MKYVVEHKGEDKKLIYYNVNIVGLNVTPKNNIKDLTIKADKIILIDPDLCESYIRKRINKKIDRVIKFMIKILNDDGTIASCHHMKFIKGEDTTHNVNSVSLVYTPTYF